jgi:hypothetical protein
MKKSIFSISRLFLSICMFGILTTLFVAQGHSQCLHSAQYGGGVAPASAGQTTTLSGGIYAGEFSPITGVAATTIYVSNSTGGGGNYITIRQGTYDGPVIAHGLAPLTWTSTVAGDYFQHISLNAACGTESLSRVSTISRDACTNTTLFGSGVAPAPGATTTLANCAYAGEYSTITGVAATTTYISSSSISTDFITIRQGTFNGPLIAAGYSPLVWTSTVAGDYFQHINTNDNCGIQSTCRNSLINQPTTTCDYNVPITGNNSITVNSGAICDHAGWGTLYSNNANGYTVINPVNAGDMVVLSFTHFDTEIGWDFVRVYDGVGTAGTLLFSGSGTTIPPVQTSVSGPLTIQFTSDGSGIALGFRAQISNITPLPTCDYNVPFTGNNSITVNSGAICDHAGWGTNYANNANGYTVINPVNAGDLVVLTFTHFNTEIGWDYVRVYDGAGTAGTLLFSGSGTTIPPIQTSTSGPLTLEFTSDGSGVLPGFRAEISNITPPPTCDYNVPFTGNNSITVNSGAICDHAGWGTNYANNANGYTVINPVNAGDMVVLTFTHFHLENCCDYVNVYDGIGTAGTLLFSGNGTAIPPIQTSTSGPLTLEFTSDGSIVLPGFRAEISNITPPPVCLTCPSFDFAITPTPVYQTHSSSITVGSCKQYEVYLNAGETATFTFCDGGATANYDTYLILRNAACVQVAANDDFCGLLSQITYTAPSSGLYYLEVNSCCIGSQGGNYTLAYRITPACVDFEDITNASVCDGDAYFWRGNTYTAAGTYFDNYVTTNPPGCDSVYVLNLAVHPVYEFITNAQVCDGVPFSWRGVDYYIAGTYYDNLTTALGCDSIFTLNLTVNPLPVVSISGLNVFYCEYNGPVTMTGNPAGGTFSGPGVTGNEFSPATAGVGTWSVVYTYTDGNGCTNDETIIVDVDVCTSIGTVESGTLSVYPNPVTDMLTLKVNALIDSDFQWTLVDAKGKIIMSGSESLLSGQNFITIETKHLASGMYMLQSSINGEMIHTKIIKNR